MTLPAPIRIPDQAADLARQSRTALLTRPDSVPAMLATARLGRSDPRVDRTAAGKWITRARCAGPGDATVAIATLAELWVTDPNLYPATVRAAPAALLSDRLRYLLEEFGRQEESASLARMIVQSAAEISLGLMEALWLEISSLGIRSRSIDYVVTKAAVSTGQHQFADARINDLAASVRSVLPSVSAPAFLSDLPDDTLEQLAQYYRDLVAQALNAPDVPWYQDDMAPERQRPEITAAWLRSVFTMAYGPDLGIMHGEWRSRPIADAAAGDRFSDFAYERHPDGTVPQVGQAKAQMIRLYGLNVLAELLEREADGGAPDDLLRLLWRHDGIEDPRFTVCRDANGSAIETTTRDLINAERATWLLRRLRGAGVRCDTALEIGAGYGHLSADVVASGLARRSIIIDRPLNLIVAKRFLEVRFPGRVALLPFDDPSDASVVLVPPWLADQVPQKIDLLMNFISFQHMSDEVMAYYDAIIGARRPDAILLENFTLDWICGCLPRTLSGMRLAERSVRITRPRRIERALWLRS
ncbi:MAG: putative sugar O-methyltransferase [Thalassobaculaceae bacterium]|nr:putative sugar O-methyltransferase [Thalassobaculaceae bacterium]